MPLARGATSAPGQPLRATVRPIPKGDHMNVTTTDQALAFLAQFPRLAGRNDPDLEATFVGLAGLLDADGILDQVKPDDLRYAVFYIGVDGIEPDGLTRRAAAIRTEPDKYADADALATACERTQQIIDTF